MIKSNTKLTAAILMSTLIMTGCTAPEKEAIYGNDTLTTQHTETIPYYYNLDLITPSAYDSGEGIELEAGSVISMIVPDKNTAYWNTIKLGAQQAIADLNLELGFTGKKAITLSYNTTNTAYDVSEQINILDLELANYPVAIAMAPADSTAFEMQFDQALENGIPIVTFFHNISSPNADAFIGTDYIEASKNLFDKLALDMEQEGSFFILSSDIEHSHTTETIDTIKDYITYQYPNMSLDFILDLAQINEIKEEIITEQENSKDSTTDNNSLEFDNSDTESDETETSFDYDSISIEEVFNHLLKLHPEINGCFITDETAGHTYLNLDQENLEVLHNISSVSFGVSSTLITALENHKITALSITNPYGQAYASIIAAARAAINVGNEAVIQTGSTVITLDNYQDEYYEDVFYYHN